ncbi:MAG: NAD(P)/FAD-dependent oxidoreductase, partial [Alphaproteobacteria bacterium]
IGAGHNGLVCAGYLAQQGQSVLVLEAGAQVGGGAQTREFAPGYKVSSCAHFAGQLHPRVIKDLGISVDYAVTGLDTIALSAEGAPLKLTRDQVTGPGLSDGDVAAYPKFKKRMREHMALLAPYLLKTPPRIASGEWADAKTLAQLGFDLRFRHGKEKMQDFLRIIGINVYDALNECFESELIKGALSLDAVLGGNMAPRTPNTLFNYLYHLTREIKGAGGHAVVRGGMGKLTEAIATAAASHGADIRVNAPVEKIIVEGSRAVGIQLASGDQIHAQRIISNADPKTTFMSLLGARHLEAYFAHRITKVRMKGSAAKLHVALKQLPNFKGLDKKELGNRLVIAPSMDEVERAYNHVKYGEFSEKPAMEISIPTIHDPSLAPEGAHVLSAIVQYAPYDLKSGWESGKAAFADRVIGRLSEFAPDIGDCIDMLELLTPTDLEGTFNMGGGHWHQGEMSFDQIMMMRPVYGSAQYQTPMDGLYLCGAGAHPGGGVMGAAGHNAAQAILAEGEAS